MKVSCVPTVMENHNPPERAAPIQYVRGSRAFRQFKNPPQPHMCIQDTIKDTSEKLFINVLGWQKIANPKHYSDPIPLYGGMQRATCARDLVELYGRQHIKRNSSTTKTAIITTGHGRSKVQTVTLDALSTVHSFKKDNLIKIHQGFTVPQGCGLNNTRPPLLVFAVMVNPDILKANGKNATNATDREALVSLLCDFVEAMNPGLVLTRNPMILKDRDLAGELKDVWVAVQNKREREKGMNQDVMYKVYDIDGIGSEEGNEEDKNALRDYKQEDNSQNFGWNEKKPVKSSKQILMNAGQKSEFDSGMNNCQINQSTKDSRCTNSNSDTTYCTPMYGQIVSSRENHNQINDIQQKLSSNETATKPSSSFRKDWNPVHGKTTEGWDEFSKRNISTVNSEGDKKRCNKTEKAKVSNGKAHYDFFPVFDNKNAENDDSEDKQSAECINKEQAMNEDNSKIILDPMQKLVLHSTDNKICDNKKSAFSSISS